LLLAPVGGVLVDRWPRNATMMLTTVLSAVLLLPLLLVHDRGGLPLLLLMAVLINAAVQLVMTAAGAALPVVAGQANIGQANSLMSLLTGGVAVMAPGLAALLYGSIGPHGAIIAMAVIIVVAAPLLGLVPAARAEGGEVGGTVSGEMLAGLAYVRRSRLLLWLVIIAAVSALGFGALTVLDVVYVNRALHLPSSTVGLLLSASGIGELIGGLVMSSIARRIGRHFHLLLGLSTLMCGSAWLAYSLAQSLAVAIASLACAGFMFPAIIVSFTTLQQRSTEDAFMGRVNSLVQTAMGLMMLLSLAFSATLTDAFGVRHVIGAGSGIFLVSGVLSLLTIRATPPVRAGHEEEQVQAIQAYGD
jgi:MFS family permease